MKRSFSGIVVCTVVVGLVLAFDISAA